MPRRSNGCETCKRRKVKCDETKPTCLRCPRQGYECEGYADPATVRRRSPAFRDQTQRVAARAQASYARSSVTVPVPRGSPVPRNSPVPKEYSVLGIDEHPTILLSSTPPMGLLPTLQEMETSRERRSQMLSNFIHLYLPHYHSNLDRSHFAYMYLLPDIIGQHPAIPSAVDALCMYHLGREYNDPDIVAKSKSIYGNAIARLASNLDKTNRYAPTGTLAAIILLAQCELNQGHSTNSFAWENHFQGALLLLESFEPLAWDTNEGRLLLQGLRYVLACQGLIQRKAIIFTRPEWQELVTGEGASDIWVSLMNFASQIPGQLEESDKLFGSSPSPRQAERVLAQALQLRSQLLNWYSVMVCETAAVRQVTLLSLDWYQPTPFDAEFGYVFSFQDCRSCYLNMQYYFFTMALSINIIQLYDSGLVDFAQHTLPSREAMEQETQSLACSVARCIPTILDPQTPSVSRFNGAISIKLAGEFFYNYGRFDKANWCREMGRRLQQHSFHIPETMKLRLPDDDDDERIL